MAQADDLGLVVNDIVSLTKSGTGAPGTVDTYTFTLRDGKTFSFQVTNGANGGTGGVEKHEFTTVSDFTDWYLTIDLSMLISVAFFDADYNSMLCYIDNSGANTKLYKTLPNGVMQELSALSTGEKIVAFLKVDETLEFVPVTREIAGINLENNITENALFDKMNIKGRYATLTALQTANPNHGYCYLVEENNHWYYWNGSAWTDGGQYLETSTISNLLITSFMLSKGLNKIIENILPLGSNNWQSGRWDNTDTLQSSTTIICTTGYVEVTADYLDIIIENDSQNRIQIVQFDSEYSYLGGIGDGFISSSRQYSLNKNCKFLKFNINKGGLNFNVDNLQDVKIIVKAKNNPLTQLRITTFNFGAFNHGVSPSGILTDSEDYEWHKLIGKLNSDIIMSQECPAYYRQNVSPKLEYGYLFNDYYPYIAALSPNIIFSKIKMFDISSGTFLNNRPYKKAYITINNKKICLLDVHTTPGMDSASKQKRQDEFANIIAILLIDEAYFVMCGDLNIESVDELDIFREQGYTLSNGGKYGIFNTYTEVGDYLYPLDNIILSANIKLVDVEMLEEKATSDHRSLRATIQIR